MTTGPTSFDERYRAVETRDARFDGQFVTAVLSTGIYCRPSCPARTPKPANVAFYPTSAAAHEAGFRACKRCLPEAAPGSPAWNVRGDAAGRAMRLITEGVVDAEGVPGLARRLGYSPRHLTRVLTTELGAGPLALARAHRAWTARLLLVETDLPVSDVAFGAGFASLRQFNDTVREVFGLTPTELRRQRRTPRAAARTGHRPTGVATGGAGLAGRADQTTTAPGEIDLLLPHRTPIDLPGLFNWVRVRTLPGVEHTSPVVAAPFDEASPSYTRVLRLDGGPAWFQLHLDALGNLRLRARLTALADLGALVTRARRLFDLDADPVGIGGSLARQPELVPLIARTPGIRVPGAVDPHEMLVRAMVSQQISTASATSMLGTLAARLGERLPDPGESWHHLSTLFPTMTVIAERGHEVLRGPARRIAAIRGAAAALASGDLVLTSADDGPTQRAALLAMPGIGPWTADYVRMRILADPDVLLPGDVAARTGAAVAGVPSDARGLTDWAARTAPWRSYLTAHLWRAVAPTPGTTGPSLPHVPPQTGATP
ncbi:MAG: DNA-3-methyladenine glycosylase [Micrococcales bacterium 73-15]|uniref:DNA-3-methyladenine glycosylase 2 family protein n=1 Tax=Salana multivorans TaxID=120377 RepID=UPI0009686E0D|nr:Ada metal-binding domain-containing protein [Salana multivorans]OJX94706.1 MAG: DNA-3-methyladenine glycosylase [Micrococcales bacterium 73-15]